MANRYRPVPQHDTFACDGAGRLSTATVAGVTQAYEFAATGGCGAAGTAGRNTNRTRLTVGTATPVTYCYDVADKLTSSQLASSSEQCTVARRFR